MKQPVRTTMSDFLKTTMGSQFVIPVYQRSYTWRPEGETARLLNDIESLLKNKKATHFLGILIYTDTDIATLYKEIQIVDGQQRLTTFFLLLLALLRVAKEKKETDTAGLIEDYYLYNRHAVKNARMRLKPAVARDDTYAHLVYDSYADLDRAQRETNVYRNYEYMYNRLSALCKTCSITRILETLSRIDILAFPLSDSDNAQEIFEAINSTGEPLTSADLIRNSILMNDASDVQERNYSLYWQPLEKMIPDTHRLEEFFRYFLAAKTYSLPTRRDTYEAFKAWWRSSTLSKEEKMRDVARYCRYWMAIYTGPHEDAGVEAALHDFRYNESRMPASFFMEMLNLHQEGRISGEDLEHIIRLIDTYLTRRALLGLDTAPLARYFPQLLRSVMSSFASRRSDIFEITKLFLINYNRGRALSMPTDRQIRTAMKETNAYALLCIRPVLERIEHHDATAQVDTAHLNIEHIMPQHPNDWWRKNSGAENEEEYTFYANLIGNLTLCAEYDNTRMGNENFSYKKKVLAKTMHIRMNVSILEQATWKVTDILKRCDRLADEIIAIYPYQSARHMSKQEVSRDDVIVLNTPSVNARAINRGAQGVEILSGSTMKPYGKNEMRAMQAMYRTMMERSVLYEDENAHVQFARNYRFRDLNTAAQFLMHRGGNNAEAWTHENGTPLKEETTVVKQERAVSRKEETKSEETSGKPHPRRSGNVWKTKPTSKNVKEETKPRPQVKPMRQSALSQPSSKKGKARSSGSKPTSRANHRRPATMAEKMDMRPQKQENDAPEEGRVNSFWFNLFNRKKQN